LTVPHDIGHRPADGSETLVIDCSLTMAWYFGDEATAYTDAVRDSLVAQQAVVPTLWSLEVANVLVMGERRKRSTEGQAARWLRLLSALPIAIDSETPFRAFDSILSLARHHRLTAYDAAYLELALRRSLPIATLDDDLKNAAHALGVALYEPTVGAAES
jgi:predicted nucleic acid-binding protein